MFITYVRFCFTNTAKMVRILNVAEKNDAAKSLAEIMSRGSYRRVCFAVLNYTFTNIVCNRHH